MSSRVHTKFSHLKQFAFFLSLFVTITTTFTGRAWADDQEKILESPLKAKSKFKSRTIAPGSQATLYIDIDLAPGHKAYVDMFKIHWKTPADTKITGFSVDPSFKFEDKFSGKIREGMHDHARLTALVEFPEHLELGEQNIEFDFTYQACTESYCHFPKTINESLMVRVVNAAEFNPGRESPDLITDSFLSALDHGKLYTFLFVFIAGLLTSLTPCIFPMIPITLAIIGARSAGQKKFRSFTLSLTYVFGIAMTYATLGVVAARTGALFGSYLGHPLVVAGIAIVFVAMGLSMYGIYDLQVPAAITNRLMGGKTSAGYLGAFTTGLITGIVASPCVGPVLVSILTYVAETRDLVFGFFLLFVFALGLGQLFVWLGTFGGLLQRLPKSGPWMDFVKFVFGTTMIAAALWYLRPVLSERIFYAVIAFTLVLISSGFGAFDRPPMSSRLAQIKRGSLLLMLVVGLAYGIKAVWYIDTSHVVDTSKKLNWQPYSETLLMNAKKEHRPVIVDFWAEWCVACKEIEVFTLTAPSIRELSKEFVLLKLDATTSTPEVERLKHQHSVRGLPTMLFYSRSGVLKRELTLTGFEKAAEFEARMQKAMVD